MKLKKKSWVLLISQNTKYCRGLRRNVRANEANLHRHEISEDGLLASS